MPTLVTGATAGFYEATAQILPIFLLAMLIGESRMGIGAKTNRANLASSLLIYIGLATIVIAGEVAALVALGSGETGLLRNVVCAAVGAGIAFLMMRFMSSTLNQYRHHFSAEAQRRQIRIFLVVTVLILLGTQLTLSFATR